MSMRSRPDIFHSPHFDRKKWCLKPDAPEKLVKAYEELKRDIKRSNGEQVPDTEESRQQ